MNTEQPTYKSITALAWRAMTDPSYTYMYIHMWFSDRTFCLYIPFVVIHFVSLYFLYLYVCRYTFCHWITSVSAITCSFVCADPAISLHWHHVSLVQWTNHLLPVVRDPGSILRGTIMWNRDSPISVVSPHWWPWCDWSLWVHLRRASSQTITRPSYWQCDNPTWSHTALLSRFHAHCRFSFQLHNRHSRLLEGSPLESLQSHCINTISHWSSGLTVCFPSWGTQVQSSGGHLCETGILQLALATCSLSWLLMFRAQYTQLETLKLIIYNLWFIGKRIG